MCPGARKCKELLTELTNTASEAVRTASNNDSQTAFSQMPLSMPSTSVDRRQGLPGPSSPLGPNMNRPFKNKPRAPSRSREPIAGTRRSLVPSAYRVQSQRDRSTSRKRGHDESELTDGPANHLSLLNIFSPTLPNAAKHSPHSSPASANIPSPPSTSIPDVIHSQNGARLICASPYSSPYSHTIPPLSPLSVSSPPRPEYDFNASNTMGPPNSNQWTGNRPELQSLEMYPSTSQNSVMQYPSGYDLQSNSVGSSWYNGASDMSYEALPTSPPTTSFDAPGLPFHGLDFIRNYNPGGYSVGSDQDSLWQGFDAGVFGVDPDLPFALGDFAEDPNGGQQWSSNS